MKMLLLMLSLLSLLLSVACGDKKSDEGLNDGNLTVQVLRKTIDGELRAMLMLCDGDECRNALRNHNGDEFYFPKNATEVNRRGNYLVDEQGNYLVADRRDVNINNRAQRINQVPINYGHVGSSQHIGSSQGFRGIGVTVVNGKVGFHYESHTRTHYNSGRRLNRFRARVNLRSVRDYDDTPVLVGYDRSGEPIYLHRSDKRDYRGHDDRHAYRDNEDFAETVGTVAGRIELMRAVAEDTYWQNKEQSLQQLFVHGEAIRVNKNELRSLLEIVTVRFNAVIDAEVKDFLVRR